MIVLGADAHKRSHTIAAVAARTGELLGEQTVQSGAKGSAALLGWARGLGRRARLGARGLPACLRVVGAVLERARRAGAAGAQQVDVRVTARSSRARQVRQHRRAVGRASGAASREKQQRRCTSGTRALTRNI